jgi:hypothetical protein
MTFTPGTEVHYIQWPTGLRIQNAVIISGPHLTRDEPGDEPYEVYTVEPTGAHAWTSWDAERIHLGHIIPLDPWP